MKKQIVTLTRKQKKKIQNNETWNGNSFCFFLNDRNDTKKIVYIISHELIANNISYPSTCTI